MHDFDLQCPRNLSEALDALSANDPRVQPLSGGTDLIVEVRSRRRQPNLLVSLDAVPELRGITRANGALHIGARTIIADFLTQPLLLEHADLLRQAAQVFANPMIRNLATLAGNLDSASPAGDMLPPLLALDAQVGLVSKTGTRTLPLQDFFLGPRKSARRPDELISAIQVPISQGGAFYKLGMRRADAISIVSVAVWLERDATQVRDVRIALGAVAARPLRALRGEEILRGQPFTETNISEAARVASEECSPIDDLRASANYRRRMVRVYVKRMLEKAWQVS